MNRECRNCAHLAAVSVEQALEPDKNDPTILRASCIRCDKHKRFVRPSAFCAFFRPYTEKVEEKRWPEIPERVQGKIVTWQDWCIVRIRQLEDRLSKLEGKCRNG